MLILSFLDSLTKCTFQKTITLFLINLFLLRAIEYISSRCATKKINKYKIIHFLVTQEFIVLEHLVMCRSQIFSSCIFSFNPFILHLQFASHSHYSIQERRLPKVICNRHVLIAVARDYA